MRAVLTLFLSLTVFATSTPGQQARAGAAKEKTGAAPAASFDKAEFERLRSEGNDALYNTDYATARERYTRLTKIAPDHPAGYVYLANNVWLETLYLQRRLTTSTYTAGSFYEQDKDEDKVDPKRDLEFKELIKHALTITRARLAKDPNDVEATYYNGAALGLRAGYSTTVARSFRRAIGDANNSVKMQRKVVKLDPTWIDAYMSIGLYEYVIDSLPTFWKLLARVAGLKGSKKKGIELLEMVAEKGSQSQDDARVLLIGIYSREGQHERSLDVISKLAQKYPRNYLFQQERATMLYHLNRADEGARVYTEMLKDTRISQTFADLVYYQWGEALMAKGDYAAAIEKYNAVKQWQKSHRNLISLAHLKAGQALDALGKRNEAVAEYQVVLKRENIYDSHKLASQYVKKPYAPAKG
jgi:tetratricopeptide (TPR) repeat protein